MKLLFANNAVATLTAPITAASVQLFISLGEAPLFPTPMIGDEFFKIIVEDRRVRPVLREIMHCTRRDATTLYVTRAQEGTTALDFLGGATVSLRWTRDSIKHFLENNDWNPAPYDITVPNYVEWMPGATPVWRQQAYAPAADLDLIRYDDTGAPLGPVLRLVRATGAVEIAYDATADAHALNRRAADARFLQLAGGTMLGMLTLSGLPTVGLHAATKSYVDAHAARVDNPHQVTVSQIGAAPLVHSHAINDVTGLQAALDGKLPLTGGTLSGTLIQQGALSVIDPPTGPGTIEFRRNGSRRWQILRDAGVESGGDVNSHLQFLRFSDTGSFIDAPLTIYRSTGLTNLFPRVSDAAGTQRLMIFATGNVARWVLGAESTAEGGANSGSGFVLNRFSDAGAYLGTAFAIDRATGAVRLAYDATDVDHALNRRTGDARYLRDAPVDGQQYARKDAAWAVVAGGGGGGIAEAPNDGALYGRQSLAWAKGVKLGGDTMTGLLTLSGAPTAALHAATKTYVDTADATKLGDAPNDGAAYGRLSAAWQKVLPLVGGTMLGALTLSGAPTVPLHAATKAYVDGLIVGAGIPDSPIDGSTYGRNTGAWVAVIMAAGGTMTGDLTISKASAALNLNKPAGGTGTSIRGRTAAVNRWQLLLGDGTAESFGTHVGSNFTLTRFDDSGTNLGSPLVISRATGMSQFNGNVIVNDVAATNRFIHFSTASSPRWYVGAESTAEGGANAGSNFVINRLSDAGAVLGTALTLERSSGNVTFASATTTLGNLFINKNNPVLTLDKGAGATQQNRIVGRRTSSDRWDVVLGDGTAESAGSGSNFLINRFDDAGGALGAVVSIARATGLLSVSNDTPTKPTAGSWSAVSDSRIKRELSDYGRGLFEILALRPRTWRFRRATGLDPDRLNFGFVAQEVEEFLPECVTVGPVTLGEMTFPDMRTLDITPITFALVNAVKELTARLVALEGTP